MSAFVSRDILPDLWEEILKQHWTFLETEESIKKMEERKKLEGYLKEFLCVIPHDRKFFLPETAHVLRKSMREMDNFSAYKAIIGFESISQYANNLFTKPWRKEFRVLKLYSGFYQHEIKSNLMDAVKLFEAMGYRRLSEEILVLDGPICPDQVTNVSRDAMAAYVECQIMKHIYAGLVAMGLTCSWQDIYHYREKYVGGPSQAIKNLVFTIQERRLRKEKLINLDNRYVALKHKPQAINSSGVSQCPNCTYHTSSQLQCSMHNNANANDSCSMHNIRTSSTYNGLNANNAKIIPQFGMYHQQPDYGTQNSVMQPHMSHSRSLEHYSEPVAQLPHRHSFDNQEQACTIRHYQPPQQLTQHVYESPYDCIDGVSGGSSASYAAVLSKNSNVNPSYSHPYNVSGNRYPLPFNISNQLNSHYATAAACNGAKSDLYNHVENDYATVSKPHNCNYRQSQLQLQPPIPPERQLSSTAVTSKDFQSCRQRSFPPDPQLIDFDDRTPLPSQDFHAQMHALPQYGSLDYDRDRVLDHQRRLSRANVNSTYAQPKDIVCQHHAPHANTDEVYGSYVYARPLPKSSRTNIATVNMAKKSERNLHLLDGMDSSARQLHTGEFKYNELGSCENRRKLSMLTNEASDSYESAFDDCVLHSDHRMQRSPTQASKNRDGVGSFESWNYVFQNLERSGYSKDLGERGDLLVQSLDLDSLTLSNGGGNGGLNGAGSAAGTGNGPKGTDRHRSNQLESTKLGRHITNDISKARTLEKGCATSPRDTEKSSSNKGAGTISKQEKSILKQPNMAKKTKSALKPALSNNITVAQDNNNGNGDIQNERNLRKNAATTLSDNRKQSLTAQTTANQLANNPNEWSCRYCTFLNPHSKRICEMCCRSKDFNMEVSVSHTPTCV